MDVLGVRAGAAREDHARHGLEKMHRCHRAGIRAILRQSGSEPVLCSARGAHWVSVPVRKVRLIERRDARLRCHGYAPRETSW